MNRIHDREQLVRDAQANRIGLRDFWQRMKRTYDELTEAEKDVDQYNADAEPEGRTSPAGGE